ncbi:MAG: hypothetical protein JW841_16955 [Deltaproteobacteria bacterium]|nr:hypothetical protein [Deltaproteobacteria bacterium]
MIRHNIIYLVICIILILLWHYSCASAARQNNTDKAEAELSKFFANPIPALQKLPFSFRIIALSNLAEYYASRKRNQNLPKEIISQRIDKIISLAHSRLVNPYKTADLSIIQLGNNGLYLSHLNIILGTYETVNRNAKYKSLNKHISTHLAQLSHNQWAHAQSFAHSKQRWPADQSALLFSLWLYDQNFNSQIAVQPIKHWLLYMSESAVSDFNNLPVSEITNTTKTSQIPRGCALSFSIRYMAAFAHKQAIILWKQYIQTFKISFLGFSGLREWPPNTSARSDIDSGPIIMEVGAAATGFGLGAARAVDDEKMYKELTNSITLLYSLANQNLRQVGDSILARSIFLQGQYFTKWYDNDVFIK